MDTAPPLAPVDGPYPFYFVLCDYGPKIGQSFYEADPAKSDRATVVKWLFEGQYTRPVQVIEVDLAAGKSRDASKEVAQEVAYHAQKERRHVAPETLAFLDRQRVDYFEYA